MKSFNFSTLEVQQLQVAKDLNKPSSRFRFLNNAMVQFYNSSKLKSSVVSIKGRQNRLCIPKQDRKQLGIGLGFLLVQVQIESEKQFVLQIGFSDINKTKRRIIFMGNSDKVQKKHFYIKLPSSLFKFRQWINLCIDVRSFAVIFATQMKSIDSIQLGPCQIRRVLIINFALSEDDYTNKQIKQIVKGLPKHLIINGPKLSIGYSSYFYNNSLKANERQSEKSHRSVEKGRSLRRQQSRSLAKSRVVNEVKVRISNRSIVNPWIQNSDVKAQKKEQENSQNNWAKYSLTSDSQTFSKLKILPFSLEHRNVNVTKAGLHDINSQQFQNKFIEEYDCRQMQEPRVGYKKYLLLNFNPHLQCYQRQGKYFIL